MNININYKKKVFFYNIYNFFYKFAYSEIIKKIEVNGNERLAKETIIIFSELNINDDISSKDLNNAFRKLYETDYFKDIQISFNQGELKIIVDENPLIQTVIINGKKKNIVRRIKKITRQIEKYPYLENNINNQKNLLINIVRNTGFYFAESETKVQDNANNTVNIVYNFNLGERAKITEIKFIGNKIFKNNKLRKLIVSEESKPWKFITKNKYLNEKRIELDVNLLKNYFKNKGYYNVIIKSSSAKVIDKNNFILTFNIEAGKKYFFNNIELDVSDDYAKENFFINFFKIFDKLKGKTYSLNSIKKIINEIDRTALQKEFVFINAKYQEELTDNIKLTLKYFLKNLKNIMLIELIFLETL